MPALTHLRLFTSYHDMVMLLIDIPEQNFVHFRVIVLNKTITTTLNCSAKHRRRSLLFTVKHKPLLFITSFVAILSQILQLWSESWVRQIVLIETSVLV